jgi:hypothetical protein
MNPQKELKKLLSIFLNSGEDLELGSLIDKYPELLSAGQGEYPDFHRISDIYVSGKIYRICRQISKAEKITLHLIDELREDPGVPLWLEGEKLKIWQESEVENPAREAIDWTIYR